MTTSECTIDRAIGVLMWRLDLDDNQAFRWLVDATRHDGSTVLEAAQRVLARVVDQAPRRP